MLLFTRFFESKVDRGVAQPGSALEWGSRGRWFESSRPDFRHKRGANPTRFYLKESAVSKAFNTLIGIWRRCGGNDADWQIRFAGKTDDT